MESADVGVVGRIGIPRQQARFQLQAHGPQEEPLKSVHIVGGGVPSFFRSWGRLGKSSGCSAVLTAGRKACQVCSHHPLQPLVNKKLRNRKDIAAFQVASAKWQVLLQKSPENRQKNRCDFWGRGKKLAAFRRFQGRSVFGRPSPSPTKGRG